MLTRLGVVVTACTLAAQPAEGAFHYTHRISVEGQITDHWNMTDPASCASNGDGTITATFHTMSTARLRPFITPFSDAIRTGTRGRWVMGVPAGGGTGDLGARPVVGTVTTVDNTVKGPNTNNPSDSCVPDDKSGCGTAPLDRSKVKVTGYNRRSIWADLGLNHGNPFSHNPPQSPSATAFCRTGSLESWSGPPSVVGGVKLYGDLLVRMPSRSKLAHNRVVTVTATTHQVSASSPSVHSTEVVTDDVTRTVTVTFTKL